MKRRGGILLESIVGISLLSLLLVSTAQILSLMQRQSRMLSQRTAALQECHIALASLANQPAEKLDAKSLAEIALPADAQLHLPDGNLEVTAEAPAAENEGVRLRARVMWRPAPSADPAQVELSVWRFDLPTQGASTGGSP
jgi:type II secretory pathway pseudopilin PulG